MGKFLFFGATRGLGLLTAKLFRSHGHDIILLGRKVPKDATEFQFYPLDMSDTESLTTSFDKVMQEVGLITGCCFFQRMRPSDGSLEQELKVGVIATQILVDSSVTHLDSEDDHPFIFVSSVNSKYISKHASLGYHISKSSLDVMAKYFAVKYGKLNTRFNTINPSTFVKPETRHLYKEKFSKLEALNPLNRLLTAEDVAETIFFASSRHALSLNAANLFLDNGISALWPEGE